MIVRRIGQIEFMDYAIKTEIIEKAKIKINVLTLVLGFIAFGCDHIENQLRQNNLYKEDIDSLIDDRSPMYNKIDNINKETQSLKQKILHLDK